VDAPETQYAKIGGLHIGYQIWGDGPVDILELHNGTLISIDETTEEPSWLRYERRLSSFCRLIRFDYRGLGLSDPLPPGAAPTLVDLAHDALGLLDVVGSARPVLLGPSGGAFVAMTMALTSPQRFTSLVMVNSSARVSWAPDYPIGVPQELIDAGLERIDPSATAGVDVVPDDLEILIPSRVGNQRFREWWIRAARRGASPTTAMAFNRLFFSTDLRARLAEITQPTLVIARSDLFAGVVKQSRYLAEHIPGAHFVELPGTDLVPYGGDFESLVDEIQEFVTGERAAPEPNRALATILFTDIVGSTALAADLGDRQWRAVLEDHDAMVRREVTRHGGRYVKDTGDGLLATFDGPAQGIRCSMAMIDAARRLGLELRAGLHTGEVELRGDDVGGIAVHIGSRISALADPGEVLVSSTVKDLIVGSDIAFADRGTHTLKGVPGEWRILAVAHL
jgi:class 3 adenylate cyclase